MMKKSCFIIILFLTCYCTPSIAFALLSHQAVIDETWKESILPLLKLKYPDANEKELNDAYAYLYGGALMPDIGYSPMGSILFTNLVHYVRSGDFIENVIHDAENINEYAFGIGLLCHYQADRFGHSLGTNLAVPILYPDLKKKYGESVAFEKCCSQHTRVEFGFDVIQTANGNYDLDAKRKFVSFKVSEPVLRKAFLKTYGLELEDIFGSMTVAIETFRFAVKTLIPELTEDAWRWRNNFIMKLNPLADRKSYTQRLNRKEYKKEFGWPGPKTILLSFVIGIVPKLGPTSGLKYKEPNAEVEKIFENSFRVIVKNYKKSLLQLQNGSLQLENINFDTGLKTVPGSYELADDTYYKLLKKLNRNDFQNVQPALKRNLSEFYSAPVISQKYQKSKIKTIRESVTAMNSHNLVQ